MRTLWIVAILAGLVGALTLISVAAAKGPFSAEISGGDLGSPITIEGPLSAALVFASDGAAVAPPETLAPAYSIKLTQLPSEETNESSFTLTMTYFPGEGDEPALLSGEWDPDRYFRASPEFQAMLDGAIEAATQNNGGGPGAVWYIAPGLALGLVLVGGAVGRRLLAAARK